MTALAIQGCTVTTDNGGNTGYTNSDYGFDPAADNTTSCNGCLYQQCSGQWSSCSQNLECRRIYQCALNCNVTDGNCVQNCYDSHPDGRSDYYALASCDTYFGCPVGSGGNGTCSSSTLCQPDLDVTCTQGSNTNTGPVDCQSCTNQQCNVQKSRCLSGSECELYNSCVNRCTQSDINIALACVDDCGSVRPQGKSDSDALANCTTSSCASSCNGVVP